MRAGWALVALAALAVLAATVGCGREAPVPPVASERQGPRDAERSGELEPLPEPELASLEGAVRDELRAARSQTEKLLAGGDPGAGAAVGELGKMYLAHSLLDPAALCFRNAEALDPAELRWPYYLGRTERRRNDLVAAEEALGRVLAGRPRNVPTLIALADLALDGGRPAAAAELFERALEVDRAVAAAHAGLGRTEAAARRYSEAVGHFEEALRLQPAATAVHYALGMAYRELGDLERARLHLERSGDTPAAVDDPWMREVTALAAGSRVHLLRAGSALEAGRVEEGIAELRRSIELEPSAGGPRVTLGAVLAQRGERQAAREQFAAALEIDPEDARAHYNLGLLALEGGEELGSIEHLRAALASDPGHERAAFQLAAALSRLGRDEEALAVLAGLRRSRPVGEDLLLREAAILARLERYAETLARLEEAAGLESSARAVHPLARLLAAAPDDGLRDGPRALALALEVATAGGLFEGRIDFDLGQTLAMAYAETGQLDRAVALQEALVAAARRDGRTERLPVLSDNLARYRAGSACRVPWPADDPFLSVAHPSEM